MNAIRSIVDGLDLAALAPERLGAVRAILRGAIESFLGQLPAGRVAEIARSMDGVPRDPPAARLLAFFQRCPTLHKFGQLLARRRELDPALRTALQTLESLPPTLSMGELRPLIESALAPFRESCDFEIGDRPIAEASLAVIVPITFRRPHDTSVRPAVAKLLKPGVVEHLGAELDALSAVAAYLERDGVAAGVPPLRYRDVCHDVRTLLTHEVDLCAEAGHLAAAARRFRGAPDIVIPEPLPFSSPGLLAMRRVDGRKVTAAPDDAAVRRSLARIIVKSLIADVMLSTDTAALFHADPHAGNLFLTDDGRLAILDWSLVGRLERTKRRAVMRLIAAAITLDEASLRRALDDLTERASPAAATEAPVRRAMEAVADGSIPGLAWLVELLDGLAAAGASFSPDMLLMRKSLWLIEGVLADLCPDYPVDATLMASVLRAFALDWPNRVLMGPFAEPPRTHLSNAELAALAWRLPAAAMSAWQRRAATATLRAAGRDRAAPAAPE